MIEDEVSFVCIVPHREEKSPQETMPEPGGGHWRRPARIRWLTGQRALRKIEFCEIGQISTSEAEGTEMNWAKKTR